MEGGERGEKRDASGENGNETLSKTDGEAETRDAEAVDFYAASASASTKMWLFY